MGSTGTLEDKTLTVCYGPDVVNVTFVNFCCNSRDTAKVRSFVNVLVGVWSSGAYSRMLK